LKDRSGAESRCLDSVRVRRFVTRDSYCGRRSSEAHGNALLSRL
jgi:hypothetical protein